MIGNHLLIRSTRIAIKEFINERAFRHCASLSYYALFSLVPILLLLSIIFGAIFGAEEVEAMLLKHFAGSPEDDKYEIISQALHNMTHFQEQGIAIQIFSGFLVIFSSTAVFYSLKTSINDLWHFPLYGGKLKDTIRDRGISFVLLILVGFLLIALFSLESIALSSFELMHDLLPSLTGPLLILVEVVIGTVSQTLLFMIIYRILPDATIGRRYLLIGSLFTAVLFEFGSLIIGWYLHELDLGGTYGIMGSVMLIMAWVFYMSMIIFFGAKWTYVYAQESGHPAEYHINHLKLKKLKKLRLKKNKQVDGVDAPIHPEELD